MSRRVVHRTPQARLDLIDAALFIAENNPEAADRFLDDMNAALHRLAQHPLSGRARPELAPNLHSRPHRSYVIFYRPLPNGIDVVRVLHGARNAAPLLEET